MGNGGSRPEPDLALPQQEVVSLGGLPAIGRAAQGSGARPPAVIAQHETIEQVKNPLIWERKSFQVKRSGLSSKHSWDFTCEFTAEVQCELSIYFHCREHVSSNHLEYTSADGHAPPCITRTYPAGKHVVTLAGGDAIDLKRYPLEVFWKYKAKHADVLPMVLSLCASGVQSVVHLSFDVPSTRSADGAALTCALLKQKVFVGGREYTLQDIYGLADLGKEAAHDESAVGDPCVICLTDPRNTAVLPCRHLCVCEDCARQLQIGAATRNDHCPICRGNIAGMQVFDVRK